MSETTLTIWPNDLTLDWLKIRQDAITQRYLPHARARLAENPQSVICAAMIEYYRHELLMIVQQRVALMKKRKAQQKKAAV